MFVGPLHRYTQSLFTDRENPEKKRKKEASNLHSTCPSRKWASHDSSVFAIITSPLTGMWGMADIEMGSRGRDRGQEQPVAVEEMQKLNASFPQVWPGARAFGPPFLTGRFANYLGILMRALQDLPKGQHWLPITLKNYSTYFLSPLIWLFLFQRIWPRNGIVQFSSWTYTLLGWGICLGRGAMPAFSQHMVQSPCWWRWGGLPLLTCPLLAPFPSLLPARPTAATFGPGWRRLSLHQTQIATQRTSLCHVCCKLHHAFPVSAQHLSSLGRHEIAEDPIGSILDPPSPVDPPSHTMHGTLNFNPAVPFVWKGETIYEESYKINTESSP